MNPWLIGALIWGVGAVISFRWEAWHLVARKNWRRDKAVREARNSSWLWPLVVLVWFLCGAWEAGARLVTAGIPESRADRDEAIRRLEEEVLGATAQDARDEAAGQLHLSLQEAMNATTADEVDDTDPAWMLKDEAYLERLERSGGLCGPDTRLPSGKTMGRLSPAYRPRGYSSTHRPDYPRRGVQPESRDQEAEYEAVTKARRALELLRQLSAMGMLKDPATGLEIHKAIRQARHALQDAESGHLTAKTVKETKAQVSRLERILKAQEITKGTNAKVCTRCGCPVVQGRLGHIHVPTLGCPPPCHSATIAPAAEVPWYLTPADSPEREAVRRRTEEHLRQVEPQEITSISLDGTETTFQFIPEGYEITYLSGEEPAVFTMSQHVSHHLDSPRAACAFCQMYAL